MFLWIKNGSHFRGVHYAWIWYANIFAFFHLSAEDKLNLEKKRLQPKGRKITLVSDNKISVVMDIRMDIFISKFGKMRWEKYWLAKMYDSLLDFVYKKVIVTNHYWILISSAVIFQFLWYFSPILKNLQNLIKYRNLTRYVVFSKCIIYFISVK